MGGAAEHPPPRPELQDLQQQQTGHGGEPLLQQEAVPQQVEQLVHPRAVHLLQLLPDAVQLQHQAVHLRGGGEVSDLSGEKDALERNVSKCIPSQNVFDT